MRQPPLSLACAAFVLLWSSGWIGSKFGMFHAGTFTLLSARYALVVPILLVFVTAARAWRRPTRRQLATHLLIGVLAHAAFLGAASSAIDIGIAAGLVAFVAALQTLMTATLSEGVSGEGSSARQLTGMALGVAAVGWAVSERVALGGSLLAHALPFLAVLALSVACLVARREALQDARLGRTPLPLSLACLLHAGAALAVLAPVAVLVEGVDLQWRWELGVSVLWLALAVSLGAYALLFHLLRHLSAVRVSSLSYLVPPTTMLIAFVAFGEHLSSVDAMALMLAAVAVWLVMAPRGGMRAGSDWLPPALRAVRARDACRALPPVTRSGNLAADTELDIVLG